ncbi:uncharacterized protein VTP21DRAFT_8207 [Calcarisporiella thermophila]|uniref:uncharacterized protein n=1 Tax=Calcarisporiella thermophila TaxID=911321 RepID=UPI0037432E91
MINGYIFWIFILLFAKIKGQIEGKAASYDTLPEYDYIVVGGGSSGGLVAVELAKAGFSVLLMEAGPLHVSDASRTPLFYPLATEDPEISFSFFPKIYSEGTTQYQGETFYPRVGALGGCSIHNAMIAVYPKKQDFDTLVEITGDKSFEERKMREIYKRMEKNFHPSFKNNKEVHGKEGWNPISYADLIHSTTSHLIYTLKSIFHKLYESLFLTNIFGNPFCDLNGYYRDKLRTDVEGICPAPINVDPTTGQRGDYVGYILDTAKKYQNFHIWTDTLATRIIIDKSKTARGVRYRKGAYLYKASPLSNPQRRAKAIPGYVSARREVIISAGVYNSPQLLMLSGIGDREHLLANKITPVVDLKGVGLNLQDHYELAYNLKPKSDLFSKKKCQFRPSMEDECFKEYTKTRKGSYAFNGIVSLLLHKSSSELEVPDYAVYTSFGKFYKFYTGWSKVVYDDINTFSRVFLKAYPKLNGTVQLRTNDPYDMPYINFKYFETEGEKDIGDVINLIRIQRRKFPKSAFEESRPGRELDTDEQLKEYIRKSTFGHHACCTNKIGSDNDPLSVLDGRFRVRGVNNLRVVDGSSFPIVPGFFPVIFTHMMGLKAADMIIADSK